MNVNFGLTRCDTIPGVQQEAGNWQVEHLKIRGIPFGLVCRKDLPLRMVADDPHIDEGPNVQHL